LAIGALLEAGGAGVQEMRELLSVQDFVQECVTSGKPIEIDCAKVVQNYEPPPFMKGYTHVNGLLPKHDFEEITTECEVDDFLIHRDEEQNDAK
jgi:hypothetical protein